MKEFLIDQVTWFPSQDLPVFGAGEPHPPQRSVKPGIYRVTGKECNLKHLSMYLVK